MSGLGSEIYSGAADFGRVWTLLGAIVGTIIGIATIILGIYIITKKSWLSSVGTITAINGDPKGTCTQSGQNNQNGQTQQVYSCNIDIIYTFEGKNYTQTVYYSGNFQHYVGEHVNIYINPNNFSNISLDKNIPKFIGWIIIVIALLVMGGAWFWFWASQKYKFIAAAEGAGAGLHILSGGRI